MKNRSLYDQENHAYYVTFSCYKRRRFLDNIFAERIVVSVLGAQLARQNGKCAGFVIMPDHVHAIIWFLQVNQLSPFMKQWKRLSSFQIKKKLMTYQKSYLSEFNEADPIWQAGYYSYNIYSPKKLTEKLNYIHANPVRLRLVDKPSDWLYSSARYYAAGRTVGIPIELPE
jgi:putative transposase